MAGRLARPAPPCLDTCFSPVLLALPDLSRVRGRLFRVQHAASGGSYLRGVAVGRGSRRVQFDRRHVGDAAADVCGVKSRGRGRRAHETRDRDDVSGPVFSHAVLGRDHVRESVLRHL